MEHLDLQACDKYCVFQCGAPCYAVPAPGVREVVVRPEIVPVPGCSSVSAGVCHVRNEFLAVLRLDAVLNSAPSDAFGEQILVFTGPEGPWAALVDRVVGLETLEISLSGQSQLGDDRSSAVIGSATFRDGVVRVLEPERLYRCCVRLLEQFWTDNSPRVVAEISGRESGVKFERRGERSDTGAVPT